MGIYFAVGVGAGFVIGLLITALFGSIGVIMTVAMAKRRDHTWWYFAVAFVVALLILVFVGDYIIPYGYVRPGSDYDIAFKNFFLKGIGIGACPGLAAFLAMFVALLSPKKSIVNKQELN